MITKANKKEFAAALDKWHKAKGIVEVIDGLVFKVVVNFIDNFLDGKIPDKHNDAINKFIEAVSSEKFDEAADILGNILAAEIPTPVIDGTPLEGVLYDAVLKQILGWFFIPGEIDSPQAEDAIPDSIDASQDDPLPESSKDNKE